MLAANRIFATLKSICFIDTFCIYVNENYTPAKNKAVLNPSVEQIPHYAEPAPLLGAGIILYL